MEQHEEEQTKPMFEVTVTSQKIRWVRDAKRREEELLRNDERVAQVLKGEQQ